jgi:pyridoxine 4-dehydrogenase
LFETKGGSAVSASSVSAGTLAIGGDLVVGRIGLGAMRILAAGPDRAQAVLRRALELGVNMIDTADVYGGGMSEEAIAQALHPYPPELVIATKGGQTVVDGRAHPDCRPEHLRAACEASLRRLRLERIDLYQLHNPDPEIPLEESLGALVALRVEGKIRHIGVSNLFGADLERAESAAPIVSLQNLYSLEKRRSESELRYCEIKGLAFVPYFPLDSGTLAHDDGALGRIASSRGCSPAQIALAWLLQRSPAMVPIPGTSSLEHLEENVKAAGVRLSDDELAQLEPATRA